MNSNTLQRKVRITHSQGLHIRPSAAFAELAMRFRSSITILHNGRSANGKSVWDLLSLAALPGTELTLQVAGPDAQDALGALVDLLERLPHQEQTSNQ